MSDNSGNLKESGSKENDFIFGLNKVLGNLNDQCKVSTSTSKKITPKESIKEIEGLEIPSSKSKDIQNEKDNQNFGSPTSKDNRHLEKISEDHHSKTSSSLSLLGRNDENIVKNKVKAEDLEMDDAEVEAKDPQMRNRLRLNAQSKEKTQNHMPTVLESKVFYRSMAFTKNTMQVSKTQKRLIKQVKNNNETHTTTFSLMKLKVDHLEKDFKTIDPNDPDLYIKLELLINKMSRAFNKCIIHGNTRVGKAEQIIDKLENNIWLIHQSAIELFVFCSDARRHLKGYLKVFENAIIETAPKIGIEVRTFNDNFLPLEYTNLKLYQNFRMFLLFYCSYTEPYSIGKDMICFFCSECKCIIFSRFELVAQQNHLKNKVFSLQFLMTYYDQKRIHQDLYIETAWIEFKRNFAKGFPELTHSELIRLENNLEMPPLILPGDIHNKNTKHECFSYKYRQNFLKKNFIKDQNAFIDDQNGDNHVSERESKDLSKEEENSIEKMLVKVKTNSQFSSLPTTKEEEIEENPQKKLNTEVKDLEVDDVFQEKSDSHHEVATSN